MVEVSGHPEQRSSKDVLVGIQSLRFIAALLVVLFHTTLFMDNAGLKWLFRNGGIGVDVFFVISGFVMEHSFRPGTSPLTFLKRRFWRVWPSYALATLLYVGIFHPEAWAAVPYSLAFLPHSATPPYFGYAALGPGWTLNFEMAFYAMFAAACLFGPRRFEILLAFIGIAVAAGALLVEPHNWLNPYRAQEMPSPILGLLTSPMLLEFAAGMLIARLYRAGWRMGGSAATIALLGAAAFFAAEYLFEVLPQRHGPLGFGLPSTLLVCAAVCCRPNVPAVGALSRLSVKGGDISYALYLFHLIVLEAIRWAGGAPTLDIRLFPLAIGLALLIAWSVHVWVEVPLMSLLKPRLKTSRAIVS